MAGDLYQYVVSLAQTLREKGLKDLSAKLEAASQFASGSSSEFLGEVRLALQAVKEAHGGALSNAEDFKLQSMLKNIDREFNRVNSANRD